VAILFVFTTFADSLETFELPTYQGGLTGVDMGYRY